MTAEPAVHATNVHRRFGGRQVLRGVDLEVQAGEFVAIIGASGSGKSTLLRVLAGLDRGASGDVVVSARRMLMFQDARLLPWLRVLDNVTLGLPREPGAERARRMLLAVGLSDHERAWPATLSGGEAQRVALARALLREPDLLLLDEPFGALDAITRVTMHELLRGLHAVHRPATVLVTHDIVEALELADRVLVLRNGKVAVSVQVGTARSDDAQIRRMLLDAVGAAGESEIDRRG